MRIEKAAEKDAEEISRLISEEFPYTEATPERLKSRILRPVIRLFKGVEDGNIAGFIELECLDSVFGVWRINGIAVKPEFRQRGFGEQLAEFAVDFARKQKATQLILLVRPSNYVAKKIYKSLGFKSNNLWKSQINGKKAEEWTLQLKNEFIA